MLLLLWLLFFFCSLWSQTRQKKTHLLPSYVSFSTNFVYRMRSVQLYSHVKIGQFPERCNVNTTLQTCSHGYHYKTVCTTHVSVNDLSVMQMAGFNFTLDSVLSISDSVFEMIEFV